MVILNLKFLSPIQYLKKNNIQKVRESNAFDTTLKIVCVKCNNGWMSRLESIAKPIIVQMALNNNGITLSNEEKNILSCWATKTIYIVCQLKVGSLNIPDEHYKYFFQNKIPPLGTAIFVAYKRNAIEPEDNQFGGSQITKLKKVHIKNPADFPFLEKQMKSGKHFYVASLVVGHLVFVLIGHNFVDTDVLGKFPEGYLNMIWPVDSNNVVWPNKTPVDNIGGWNELHKKFSENIFVERFNKKNTTLIPF